MERKNLELSAVELKFSEEDGGRKFSGYASVFGGTDSYGDTILPGAYKKTIKKRERPIQMRWNHYGPVIGKWTVVQEDDKGLYVEGELTPGHSVAEDVYASLKHGSVTGLSIGYRPVQIRELGDGKRELKEIELVEISAVESPADIAAQIGNVKSEIETATTLKDYERILRDAGLARADATALVSGIKSLAQSDSETERQTAEIAGLFQQFETPQP